MKERLFTGFVKAAGYAKKVRKTLFATVKNRVETREVLRASAELNQKIFEKMQEMGVEKSDVVTIEIEFELKDGKIEWDYNTLKINVFKSEEEEKLSKAMKEAEEIEKELEKSIEELENVINEAENALNKVKDVATKMKQRFGKYEE